MIVKLARYQPSALIKTLIERNKEMNCGHRVCPIATISLISLTKGKYAIVDTPNFGYLDSINWYATSTGRRWYAKTSQYGQSYKMAKVITLAPPDMIVDHRNNNSLDNRRCNLRVCTSSQNRANTQKRYGYSSQYKGVHWSKKDVIWVSQITKEGRVYCLGQFKKEKDAAKAYNKKAEELFGEYAVINIL